MKITRTSVFSDDGCPSSGCSCQNSEMGVAFAHAGSPATSPSTIGASAARTAVALNADGGGNETGDATGIGCASATPLEPNNTA